jgi:hypothetical protein
MEEVNDEENIESICSGIGCGVDSLVWMGGFWELW